MENLPLEKLLVLKSASQEAIAHHRAKGKWMIDPLNSLAYLALMAVDMVLDELVEEARK